MRYNVEIARERIARVFRYLQEMHRVKTPPIVALDDRVWVRCLDSLPSSSHVQRGRSPSGERAGTDASWPEFIARVARPAPTECPEPSVAFKSWLKHGWDRVDALPETFVKKTQKSRGKTQAFEDSDDRVEAFESWLEEKKRWENGTRGEVEALALFSELFDLHGRFERESEKYQLFLADGVLVLDHENGAVCHPVLLQRVELHCEASVPQFTVVDSEDNPEIYTPLLRHVGLDGRAIQQVQDSVEREHFHPLGGTSTSEFLRDFVQRHWTSGQYFENPLDAEGVSGPHLYRQPQLILGHRNHGLAENIESYLEALNEMPQLPESLLRIVGVETGRGAEAAADPAPIDMLLTKHANPEQEMVIRRLEETGAVIVQGPPGTGKSHTIANLVGHLLAQNKSILVTSHASKALRVVREKLAAPLQPLCVSVLQSDEQSNRQLEESITGIVNYLASTSERKLATEIDRLTERRETLHAKREELRGRLLDAVRGEYEPMEILGETLTPAVAASRVVSEGGAHGWIPAPIQQGSELSLSSDEIAEIYSLGVALEGEDENLFRDEFPRLDEFPTPKEFAELYDEIARLEKQGRDPGEEFWQHTEQRPQALRELLAQANHAVDLLEDEEEWLRECLQAGLRGGETRQSWLELAQLVEACNREVSARESVILEHGPGITSDRPAEELIPICRAILEHLTSGKRLSKLVKVRKPAWNEFINRARIDAGLPTQTAHFEALLSHLEIRAHRERLARRWDRQMAPLGAPEWSKLGKRPEKKTAAYAESIQRALDWFPQVWAPCEAKMEELGFNWHQLVRKTSGPTAATHVDAIRSRVRDSLPSLLDSRSRVLRARDLETERQRWLAHLDGFSRGDAVHALLKKFRSSIKKGNYDTYAQAYSRLEELLALRDSYTRREALLAKLGECAEGWQQALRDRIAPHNQLQPPGDIRAAWRYRQWERRLSQLAQLDLDRLQDELKTVTEALFEVTAEYVEKRSWRAQLARTGLEQQQALNGWLGLHKKIGKGTGKHVPRLKQEAKRTLVECRSAVPVWIMPLSRVVECFDLATTRFDVVIMDEASQSDVMGLLAFALADEVVVVGDHEQVSPYAVGQKGDKIHALIDEILEDVPNKHLYDGRTSVYDLARQSFGGTIRLVEHFRCVPDIIQFSNELCYSGEIRALREAGSSPLRPHLVSHRVRKGEESNGVNEKEALEIVSLVSAVCRLEEYEGCTIGVICLVGTDQALYIDSVLRRRLSVAEYQRRQILCGNASQFQGDERDVIFLSIVNSPGDGPLPLRQRDDAKKVFNVAASRARDQLWVVHSLEPRCDLKAGDLRLRIISHAENPAEARPKVDRKRKRFGSELEKRVFRQLTKAGYRMLQQYRVGESVVDLVVEATNARRVAIQCDGDREHSPEDVAQDMDRQLTLERLGWEFIRIRASEFYRDPDAMFAKLVQRLEELEIRPGETDATAALAEEEPLKRKVLKRAELIRNRWKDIPAPEPLARSREDSKD